MIMYIVDICRYTCRDIPKSCCVMYVVFERHDEKDTCTLRGERERGGGGKLRGKLRAYLGKGRYMYVRLPYDNVMRTLK